MINRHSFSCIFLASVLCCLTNQVKSQNYPALKTVVPPSPNAATLGKYGEIPVSLHSGIPNISIPLYTIKTRDIELPISLSYHAGGNRVDEKASWVGLGWNLNMGAITRIARGALPDFVNQGYNAAFVVPLAKKYLSNRNPTTNYLIGAGNLINADRNTILGIYGSVIDVEPDIYTFNFGKYSGKFFIAENGNIVVSPNQAIKVEKNFIVGSGPDVAQWVLTTPDGFQYIFGDFIAGSSVGVEKNSVSSSQATNPITSWNLVRIISPDNDIVNFSYTNVSYNYTNKSAEIINQIIEQSTTPPASLPPLDKILVTNYISGARLTAITFSNGRVDFLSNTARTDLPGEKALDGIAIFNSPNGTVPIKKFNFSYNNGTRLVLTSVVENSGDGLSTGKKYQLEYNTLQLPNPDPNGTAINSQDLWGYYNGANNSVLPQSFLINSADWGAINIPGADRSSNENPMQAQVLKKIVYPTGGYTAFDYEANRFYASSLDNSIPPAAVGRSEFIEYLPGQTVTKTFTVQNPVNAAGAIGTVYSRQMVAGCPISNGFSQCYTASIEGINGTVFPKTFLPDGITTYTLPAGTYLMTGQGLSYPGQPTNNLIRLQLSWNEYPPPTSGGGGTMVNKVIGGLRIFRITSNDGITSSVKRYQYHKFSNPLASSGVLVNTPGNYVNILKYVGQESVIINTRTYAQVKSYPLTALTPTQGATIGYENVTELNGENGENGKTEYTFTTANDFPDEAKYYRPYPPNCSYDWRRGQLLNTVVYKNVAGSFVPVKSVASKYIFGINPNTAYGLTVETDIQGATSNQQINVVLGDNAYYVSGYKTVGEFYYHESDIERIYDQIDPLKYAETTTTYTYDIDINKGHYQLIKTATKNSKNQTVENIVKYPQDLVLAGAAETGRQNLVSKHIFSSPLEQSELLDGATKKKITTEYNLFSGLSVAKPAIVSQQIRNNPIEPLLQFNNYDNLGNLLSQQKINDAKSSYIYDYTNNYPIAACINAGNADIAATSFEADGKGNWTFSGTTTGNPVPPTGNLSYNLTASTPISKTGLTATTVYVISYWTRNAVAFTITGNLGGIPLPGKTINGWNYFEHRVSNITSVSISGTGLIDELRLYPLDAQMVTYTYAPLIGISSECDAKNEIKYYEYDGLQRLILIRDQYKNILKKFAYNYAGVAETVSLYYNAGKTVTYFKANSSCSGCLIGSAVPYTVPPNKYSAVTQAQANQLEQAELDTYGQTNANSTGSCNAATVVPVTGSNYVSTKTFTVEFRNTCTNVNYPFTLNPSATNVSFAGIPQGNYTVTISAVGGGTISYRYTVNGNFRYAPAASITVDIGTVGNTVLINP